MKDCNFNQRTVNYLHPSQLLNLRKLFNEFEYELAQIMKNASREEARYLNAFRYQLNTVLNIYADLIGESFLFNNEALLDIFARFQNKLFKQEYSAYDELWEDYHNLLLEFRGLRHQLLTLFRICNPEVLRSGFAIHIP